MDTNGQTTNEKETHDGPSFEDFVDTLGQPLPPHMVRWRLMQRPREGQTNGLAVAYISMTDVEDVLDEVIGPARWRCTYPIIGQFVVCRIELQDDDGKWIGKEDGAGDNVDRDAQNASDDDLDKDTKAVLSDAFKRAARRWGIGRYLAKLEKPWVQCESRGRSWVIAQHEYARLAELAGAPPGTYIAPQPQQPQQPQAPAQTYQQASQQPGQTGQRQQQQQQAPARSYSNNQGGSYGGQQNRQQGGQSAPKVHTIPGGKAKGTPLHEASEPDILFWRDRMASSDDPKWAAKNREWIAAADAELARRNGGGQQQQQQRPDSSRSRGNRPPPDRGGYQGPPQDDIPFGAPTPGYDPRDQRDSRDDLPF